MTTDYASHTINTLSVRDYVELNCAVDHLCGTLVGYLARFPLPARMLDIGCGFGFSSDIAKRMLGINAVGIEPSPYGKLGSIALNIPIYGDYLTPSHPIAKTQYDIVTAFQVLEHSASPDTDLSFWRTLCGATGMLLLTVPSAESVTSNRLGHSELLAILSPGAHTILFSRVGLRSALVNAGFKHIHIEISGSNLLARASCVEIPSSIEVDSLKLGAEYLTKLLADVNDPMLRRGCIFRTFAYLVNLGSYVEAAGLYDELLNSLEAPNLRAVYSYEMFSTYYAIYSGPAYYYIGIFLLNHVGDYSGASMAFSHSEFLLRTKIRVAPQSSVLEESLLPLARFHNAVAQSYTSSSAPPFFTVMKLYARQALQVLSPQTIAFLRRARMFFQSFRNKEPNT